MSCSPISHEGVIGVPPPAVLLICRPAPLTPKELVASAPGAHGDTRPLAQPQVPLGPPCKVDHHSTSPHRACIRPTQPAMAVTVSRYHCLSLCCPSLLILSPPLTPHVPLSHAPASPTPTFPISVTHGPIPYVPSLYCTVPTCPVEQCPQRCLHIPYKSVFQHLTYSACEIFFPLEFPYFISQRSLHT